MAFTPEDGTGLAGANSYTTLEFANDYFAERNVVTWTGTDEVKQGALIAATDYIEGRFGRRLAGEKEFPLVQALQFPREYCDEAALSMPVALLRATAEYALRALAGPLAPDPEVHASGYALQSTKEKVGPVEEANTFANANGTRPTVFRPYPAADMLMRGLLITGNRVIRN